MRFVVNLVHAIASAAISKSPNHGKETLTTIQSRKTLNDPMCSYPAVAFERSQTDA